MSRLNSRINRFVRLAEGNLYHGTSAKFLDSIKSRGLEPRIGKFTLDLYGNDAREKSVFAASGRDLKKAVNAIEHNVAAHLKKYKSDLTAGDIRDHGLLLVFIDGDSYFDYLPRSGSRPSNAPSHAEPGDYYTDESVIPDMLLSGERLLRFLQQRGFYTNEPVEVLPPEDIFVHKVNNSTTLPPQVKEMIQRWHKNEQYKFLALDGEGIAERLFGPEADNEVLEALDVWIEDLTGIKREVDKEAFFDMYDHLWDKWIKELDNMQSASV